MTLSSYESDTVPQATSIVRDWSQYPLSHMEGKFQSHSATGFSQIATSQHFFDLHPDWSQSQEIIPTRPSKPSACSRPSINGIHHLKLPCFSVNATHDFYTKILPFEAQPQYNHVTASKQLFAKILLHRESNLLIEVRYHPNQAATQKGWDPITFGVSTRKDLDKWGEWFDANNVKRSGVFKGVKSWIMCVEDPDGKIVRLYVEDEEHEWTQPDSDPFWLGFMEADPNA